jgi:hypothetical protein
MTQHKLVNVSEAQISSSAKGIIEECLLNRVSSGRNEPMHIVAPLTLNNSENISHVGAHKEHVGAL